MSEPEMVERVARAMFEDDELHSDQWGWDQNPPRSWDCNLEDCERESYRRNARTAIAALREPTEAMLDAADLVAGVNSDVFSAGCDAEEVWQKMIDAALTPPRSGSS